MPSSTGMTDLQKRASQKIQNHNIKTKLPKHAIQSKYWIAHQWEAPTWLVYWGAGLAAEAPVGVRGGLGRLIGRTADGEGDGGAPSAPALQEGTERTYINLEIHLPHPTPPAGPFNLRKSL
jgi:hypothetical protein